jgi:hypothetical protein
VKQHFDRGPLIHGLVACRGLVERQFEVEHLARIDLTVADQLDEIGQEATHRGGAAVHVSQAPEQLLAGHFDTVTHAHEADVPAGARGADGLHHRLLRADRLDHRMGAEPVCQLPNRGYPVLAALCDDVGRALIAGQSLAWLVAADRDDPLRTELLRGQDGVKPDGAVTHHGNGLPRAGLGGNSGEPARTKHI